MGRKANGRLLLASIAAVAGMSAGVAAQVAGSGFLENRVWLTTPTCPGSGPVAASDALWF